MAGTFVTMVLVILDHKPLALPESVFEEICQIVDEYDLELQS
jgi:hypothetical protein